MPSQIPKTATKIPIDFKFCAVGSMRSFFPAQCGGEKVWSGCVSAGLWCFVRRSKSCLEVSLNFEYRLCMGSVAHSKAFYDSQLEAILNESDDFDEDHLDVELDVDAILALQDFDSDSGGEDLPRKFKNAWKYQNVQALTIAGLGVELKLFSLLQTSLHQRSFNSAYLMHCSMTVLSLCLNLLRRSWRVPSDFGWKGVDIFRFWRAKVNCYGGKPKRTRTQTPF